MSFSDVGWAEEQIIQYDEIALEDHSYVATWQERSQNEKFWNVSLNAEGIQGPLNQRSDCIEAKQTCKRLYHEYTAITGEGHQSLLHNKSGNGLINNFDDVNFVQDGDSTFPPGRRIHLRQRIGSRTASGGQIEAGIRGKHHLQRCHFACPKFNLLAMDRGGVDRHTYRTTFSHAQLLRSCFAVLLSCTCMAQDCSASLCRTSKHFILIAPCPTLCRT